MCTWYVVIVPFSATRSRAAQLQPMGYPVDPAIVHNSVPQCTFSPCDALSPTAALLSLCTPSTQQHFFLRAHSLLHAGVNNLFAFGLDGCITWYNINQPGSFHDADIVDSFLHRLAAFALIGLGAVGDLGFRGARFDKFVATIHSATCAWPVNLLQRSRAIFADKVLTYLRQAAEWGMNSFKNLSLRLRYVWKRF